jgi:excisionase family DNA binding protein
MPKLLTVREAAKRKGVHSDTIRRWCNSGELKSSRTAGGHRRIEFPDDTIAATASTVAYARVSSHDQRDDLVRQVQVLEHYCAAHGWAHEVIQDLGSGVNYRKKGLKRLLEAILAGTVGRLVLTHRDRLLRFGAELVFSICEAKGCEVIIINQSVDTTFEEELTKDVLEIITVFSARLYGSRSHKNKKLLEAVTDACTTA